MPHKSGWPARWDRMIELGMDDQLGPKGEAYARQKFGPRYEAEEIPYEEDYDLGDYGDEDWSDPAEA